MVDTSNENKLKAFANELKKGSWKTYKFSDIAFNIVEKVTPRDSDLQHYIGLDHLDAGSVHIKRFGDPASLEGDKHKIYKGDVIVGKRNAYLKRASLAPFDAIASAHSFVLRANTEVISQELFPFFMLSEVFWETAIKISVGSLSPTINWGSLKTQQFLLPPKDQQAKLAELLWAADKMIESYSATQNQNNNCILSAYSDFFTKADVEFTSLGQVAEIIMGQSPDGSTYNTDGFGMPLLNGPTEFTERYPVKVQWTTKAAKLCKEGDILICVRGSTTGRMNISNDVYCIGRGIAAIRGNDRNLTEFIEHVLSYFVADILKLTTGSTFPNIDSKSLKEIRIPNYSLKEQTEIVGKIKLLIDAKDSLSSLIESSKQIQKQLINQIFSA